MQTPADHVSPTPRLDAISDDADAQMRFLALITRVTQSCASTAPGPKGSGALPEPEDVPGREDESTPMYGPGETPPGVPNAEGDIPVPRDAPGPPASTPDSTERKPGREVPPTGIEKRVGSEHAKRVVGSRLALEITGAGS